MKNKLGREPSDDELAEHLEISSEELYTYYKDANTSALLSLDQGMGDDSKETHISDFIKSKKVTPKTKTALINELEIAFNNVATIINKVSLNDLSTEVEFFAGPKSKLQILNLLQDHVTHHRGQLIVYLNLNEIKPPSFIGW